VGTNAILFFKGKGKTYRWLKRRRRRRKKDAIRFLLI